MALTTIVTIDERPYGMSLIYVATHFIVAIATLILVQDRRIYDSIVDLVGGGGGSAFLQY